LTALSCLLDLPTVIAALLASRILIQFVGQVATVFYLRSRADLLGKMPFRMALFPLPALVSLAGWLYVFATLGNRVIAYGLVTMALGVGAFLAWDRRVPAKESIDADLAG
jgi:hypothetical protein